MLFLWLTSKKSYYRFWCRINFSSAFLHSSRLLTIQAMESCSPIPFVKITLRSGLNLLLCKCDFTISIFLIGLIGISIIVLGLTHISKYNISSVKTSTPFPLTCLTPFDSTPKKLALQKVPITFFPSNFFIISSVRFLNSFATMIAHSLNLKS